MWEIILPERVRLLREKNNLTRKDLGDKINITYHAVRNYEEGSRVPELHILVNMADIFGVSVDYLLGRDDYLPEKYISFPNINMLDIEMIYQHNMKINKMIDKCREE